MKYGKWEVIRQLGDGGQGIAYLVRDTTKLDIQELFDRLRHAISPLSSAQTQDDYRRYARTALESIETYLHRESDDLCAVLKILHEPLRGDLKARERLRREIDILGSLDHPNVIKIIDASVDEGWFVTPYYREGALEQQLHRWKGRPQEGLEAFRSLVESVAHLHRESLVHRDIKPENIFVSDSRLVLGDFGIAYFEDNEKTRVSDTYENVGSRDWMPPWAMGMRVDDVRPSFDVYSLGKVLWAAL